MKKIYGVFFLLLALLAPVALGQATSTTIMVYMCGTDLQSACVMDMYEMASVDVPDDVTIAVQAGGAYQWDDSDLTGEAVNRFTISYDTFNDLQTLAWQNMGDGQTLYDFIDWAAGAYPADRYILVLWDHGGGYNGVCFDETADYDSLTIHEVNNALYAYQQRHPSFRLDIIGFDACLMANIETAHTLSPYANYMVASQESEPGSGWSYSFLADIETLQSGKDIGQKIVDSYMQDTTDYMNSMPFSYATICLSVLDLSQVETCEMALNDLFASVNKDFNESTYPQFSSMRKNSKEIAAAYSYTEGSYDVIDLGDYALHMKSIYPAESGALSNALNKLIVYSDANESKINGVSIYHPYYTKQYASSLIPMYTTFDFAENYTSYISRFAGMLTDTNAFAVTWNPEDLVPTMNDDSTFSVTLNAEQSSALQNAYFVIAKKDQEKDGMYDLVALSSAISNDGTGKLTADFDGQITYMQNDTTKENYELMYTVQEKTDTYTRYLISSILYNDDIEGDDSMYAYFVLEVSNEHPEGQILGAYPIDNYINTEGNEIFPERYEIDINDYQNVAFGYFSHRFTSNEDLTNFNDADWADLTINYSSFPISEGFTPIRDALLAGEEYYGMFIFEDMQGNRHCSSLVQIQ